MIIHTSIHMSPNPVKRPFFNQNFEFSVNAPSKDRSSHTQNKKKQIQGFKNIKNAR